MGSFVGFDEPVQLEVSCVAEFTTDRAEELPAVGESTFVAEILCPEVELDIGELDFWEDVEVEVVMSPTTDAGEAIWTLPVGKVGEQAVVLNVGIEAVEVELLEAFGAGDHLFNIYQW